jgi:hypothetical protein
MPCLILHYASRESRIMKAQTKNVGQEETAVLAQVIRQFLTAKTGVHCEDILCMIYSWQNGTATGFSPIIVIFLRQVVH